MEKGVRVNGGQDLGKTVIFAQNQKHARFIVERFGKLYPKLSGGYIKTVLHSDDYSHTVIDEFELKPQPVITVSVDMMDTGIDVPEIVNLVFFKKVRSKIKFWQMIGRGFVPMHSTRICAALFIVTFTSHGGRKRQENYTVKRPLPCSSCFASACLLGAIPARRDTQKERMPGSPSERCTGRRPANWS